MTGEPISHYEILDKLGEGGMGVVYKARDLRLHRLVALKFLPAEILATPERIARFEQEARAISAVSHPHIATIHAMEESEGRRFLVLEYLPGGTLRQRLKEFQARGEPFPLHEAVRIGIETAHGLAHAHRKGIVHRDIKPENVMFSGDGLLRITDFGLAKSESSDLTRDGATVGTAAYMAPEQATWNETSPRSDLFSLGVTLYELIGGERPFTGPTEFAVMQAVVSSPAAPLSHLCPEVPPSLERIVSRLLEKDPLLRHQTAEEVATELRLVENALSSATPTTEINYSGVTRTMAVTPLLHRPGRSVHSRRTSVAAVALTVAAIGATAWVKLHAPAGRSPSINQLAVLPFTAKSNSAEDEAFGSGLSGIVASKLAEVGRNLWVIPNNDMRQQRVVTPTDARKMFGVPAVITGEVERERSGTSVQLHLVDTASGKTLRSASVKQVEGGLPLQEEVLKEAASLVDLSLDPMAVDKVRKDEAHAANAYDYYVMGSGYLQRYDHSGNTGSAIAAFQKAVQLEPSYAMAYAGLGSAYVRQYLNSKEPQYLEKAREAANQALSRNEMIDSPHITLGMIATQVGSTAEAIKQFGIARDLDPVNAEAYRGLAAAYDQAGNLREAEATYRRAIQLRPSFWLGYIDCAGFYDKHGRYAEAETELSTAASLTPDNYLIHRFLGGIQMERNEWSRAEQSLKRALTLYAGSSVFSDLGTLYIYTNRCDEGISMLEQAVNAGGTNQSYSPYIWGNLGDAYRCAGGREESARQAYEKALTLAKPQLAVNPRNALLLGQIAVVQAKLGRYQEADQNIRSARSASPHDKDVLFDSTLVAEIQGRRAQSLNTLKSAVAAGISSSIVESEPELASLRKDPRYRDAVAHSMETK